MKLRFPQAIALLLLVGASAADAPVIAQVKPNGDVHLTIRVTVDPTCTVAVVPGERRPTEAVEVSCRNLRENQPQPLVLETEPFDGHEVGLIHF